MNTQNEHPHDKRSREALRDLQRLQDQSEKLLGAPQVTGEHVDDSDKIEVWGRRIGITLGVFAVIWVIHDLLSTYIFTP
jgi:hypothetical protein